ncbi:DUF397 domain-containing protein [Spiractinospora alimapuensis]|uniref:DUF397 domain-containing protein n=1 Tax=Spiractinospora alimapuensis TaxID=2820884 RepID=UPI001F386507|nr:DUF397 domain-containing protein [Spiractinospora alimapuensis]QVQ51742.1 DUF397 domain-containing protein [Spiractinospora alimapuensis]
MTNNLPWRKSSYSQPEGPNCVECAALTPGAVAMRDSQNPGAAVLPFPHTEWAAFIGAVKREPDDLV